MKENVKKFFEELDGNEQAKALLKAASANGAEPDIAALARAARETGYEVTDEEMQDFLAQLQKSTAAASDAVADRLSKLTTDELEKVAAGNGYCAGLMFKPDCTLLRVGFPL